MELRNIHIQKLSHVGNVMTYASNNEIGLVIAVYKFHELTSLINFSNVYIQEAVKETRINRKFNLLRHSILDYNTCYDYILQIIYFGFDFFDIKIDSVDAYKRLLKEKCKLQELKDIDGQRISVNSEFANDIEKLKSTNQEAKHFFNKYYQFANFAADEKYGIRQWANNIKHQGGFTAKEVLFKDGFKHIINYNEDNNITFTTEYLFPFIPTFDEILLRLEAQNHRIVQYSLELFDYMFGDTKHINLGKTEKKFSANKLQMDNNTKVTILSEVKDI